jgi:hypothetical protein
MNLQDYRIYKPPLGGWGFWAKCSQDTALRDIQNLIDRKILIKEPSGGRSTSYVLAG